MDTKTKKPVKPIREHVGELTSPPSRGVRGAIELKVIAMILLLSVAGVLWVKLRQDDPGAQARLFRFKDEKGKVVYTDTIDKVPEDQRQAVLAERDIPEIVTADYDSYLDAVTNDGKPRGFLPWFKGLFQANPASTGEKKCPNKP